MDAVPIPKAENSQQNEKRSLRQRQLPRSQRTGQAQVVPGGLGMMPELVESLRGGKSGGQDQQQGKEARQSWFSGAAEAGTSSFHFHD